MDNEKQSEFADRLKKLEKIRNLGIDPYPQGTNKDTFIFDALEKFEVLAESGKSICLAGRIKTIRAHGNLTFAHVCDQSGSMQLAFSKKEIGAESYKQLVDLIDMGDFLDASGTVFLTHKGEKSLMVKEWRIMSKALRPLPEKWHGLTDDDKRQRFRELEMLSDRTVLDKFKRKSEAIKSIRSFMWEQGFIELETPMLQNVYGGTYAKPFMTHYNALDFDLFLRIAPEIFLKRSITGGFEKIFEIGKCFRNEGMGPAHLQEFTMFEFYHAYADYDKLMDFTEKMICHVIDTAYKNYKITLDGREIDLTPPYARMSFDEVLLKYLGVGIAGLDSEEKIERYVASNGLSDVVNLKDKISWPSKLDELYKKTVRKKLIQPVFITDYPKEFMALAKAKADDTFQGRYVPACRQRLGAC